MRLLLYYLGLNNTWNSNKNLGFFLTCYLFYISIYFTLK